MLFSGQSVVSSVKVPYCVTEIIIFLELALSYDRVLMTRSDL